MDDSDQQSMSTLMSVVPTHATVGNQRVEVIALFGHVFFGVLPNLEQMLGAALRADLSATVILDFSHAWRCETCIGQMVRQKLDEFTTDARPRPLILTGIPAGSALALDLGRGGVSCTWPQLGPPDFDFDDAVDCYFDLYDGISALQPSWQTMPPPFGSPGSPRGHHSAESLLLQSFLEPRIGELLMNQRANMYVLQKEQFVDLQESSFVLAVQGTVRVSACSPALTYAYGRCGGGALAASDVTPGIDQQEHLARLPMTMAIRICLLKTFYVCRRLLSLQRLPPSPAPPPSTPPATSADIDAEETAGKRPSSPAAARSAARNPLISLRAGVHTLRAGDSYWPDPDPQPYVRGKQYTERLTALEDGCKVLVLPVEGPGAADAETIRQLLQLLERQAMYRRTLARATWKF
ncbi:hypothetical protein KEM52_002012 [Ascosphaera acerosa]|nr:hypothetical protein KEM52_002012 [Ascosphaera acerosa]